MSLPAKSKALFLSFGIVVLGLLSTSALSGYIERTRPPLPDGYSDEDLSVHGAKLKGYSFGAEGLVADWYWMRTLQYVGKKLLDANLETLDLENLRPLNPRLVEPYLRNATELDPHFLAPYYYAAVVLPSIDPQKAVELTEKGIANNPNEWRLYQYLGYIYWRQGNYAKASEVYERGSQVPGAGKFLALMAAAMKNKGGSRETAQAIYRQMYEEGTDTNIKYAALLRWQQLLALDEMDAIDSLLSAARERHGRCPETLNEILPALHGVRLPEGRDFHLNARDELIDPRGDPYRLDRNKCKTILDSSSPLPRN